MQRIDVAGCSQIAVLSGLYPKIAGIAGEPMESTLKRQVEGMTKEIQNAAIHARILICATNASQPHADAAIRAAGGYIVEHSLGSSPTGIKIWVIPGKVNFNDKYTKEHGHVQRATANLRKIDTDHEKLNSPAVLAKEQGKQKKKPNYWKVRYLRLVEDIKHAEVRPVRIRGASLQARRKKNSKKK
jgi:hypothetical protein